MIHKEGWKMTADDKGIALIALKKSRDKVAFDAPITAPKRAAFATHLKRGAEIAGATQSKEVKMAVDQAHHELGHMSEDLMRKVAQRSLGAQLLQGHWGHVSHAQQEKRSKRACQEAAVAMTSQKLKKNEHNEHALTLHQ